MATAILATMLVGFVIYELLLVRLKPDEFERSHPGHARPVDHHHPRDAVRLHRDAAHGRFAVRLRRRRDRFDPHHLDAGDRRCCGAGRLRGLYLVLRYTQFGRAMRRIAQNRDAALMVGIRPRVVARNAGDPGRRACAGWPARRSRRSSSSRPTWASS
jgi:branched-chain amino acid transport system permease protein